MLLLLNSLFIAAQLDGPTVHHLNVSDEDADHLEQRGESDNQSTSHEPAVRDEIIEAENGTNHLDHAQSSKYLYLSSICYCESILLNRTI